MTQIRPSIELPIIETPKLKTPRDSNEVRVSGSGSADFNLRTNIVVLGGEIKDGFQASISTTNAKGKEKPHVITDPRSAAIKYKAANNDKDKTSEFSIDVGYGADHSAKLNGDDTLTLSNNDKAPEIQAENQDGRLDFRRTTIRASSITVKAEGKNNTIKIDKDFTGTVILQNPQNTTVQLANGKEFPLREGDKPQTLHFKNGKRTLLTQGVDIPKPKAKPDGPKTRLLQAA
ncbi:MAG: hypothetical protein HOA17_05145 [Candidatus Melainabacteria bacterium]|jgi:hypothetical protein|nr:hypothetical protein [Candidatus Melainabacteria bacterium]